jgi:hypothetical protein
MTIHIEGNSDGEYNLGLLGSASVYSIEEKAISTGVEDTIMIAPSEEAVGHKLRMKTGLADDGFTMRLAHKFAGRTETINKDFILREYFIENIHARPGSDLEVYTEEGGDAVVVENHGDDTELDVTLRSTQSVDTIDDIDGIDYIPGSTLEDFLIETGETITFASEDWTTTERAGEMHALGKSEDGETSEFSPIEVSEDKEEIITPDNSDDTESDDDTGGSGLVGEEGSPGESGETNAFSATMVIIIVAAAVVVVAALVSVVILSRNRQG